MAYDRRVFGEVLGKNPRYGSSNPHAYENNDRDHYNVAGARTIHTFDEPLPCKCIELHVSDTSFSMGHFDGDLYSIIIRRTDSKTVLQMGLRVSNRNRGSHIEMLDRVKQWHEKGWIWRLYEVEHIHTGKVGPWYLRFVTGIQDEVTLNVLTTANNALLLYNWTGLVPPDSLQAIINGNAVMSNRSGGIASGKRPKKSRGLTITK